MSTLRSSKLKRYTQLSFNFLSSLTHWPQEGNEPPPCRFQLLAIQQIFPNPASSPESVKKKDDKLPWSLGKHSLNILTLELFPEAFLPAYLLPTDVKATWELRKKNQRLTWEKDLLWLGHSPWPATKWQFVELQFSPAVCHLTLRTTTEKWQTFKSSPDRQVSQSDGTSNQESSQRKDLV